MYVKEVKYTTPLPSGYCASQQLSGTTPMSQQAVEFFRFLSSARSLPRYNTTLDYGVDKDVTQNILGRRVKMFKDIGQIVLDTDEGAIAALNSPDWRIRSHLRNMAHNIADTDWIANVAASAACDRMLFSSKNYCPDTRMHHPKLDEPKAIDPKFKSVWNHYLESERTWNHFLTIMKPYVCSTIDADVALNVLPTSRVEATIGEEDSMIQLVRRGCRTGKEQSIGIIEESFCLAALGLAALVTVSEHDAK